MNDDLVNGLVGESLELEDQTYGVVEDAHLNAAGSFEASIHRLVGEDVTLHVHSYMFENLTAGVDTTEELSSVLAKVIQGQLIGDHAMEDWVALGTPPGPGTGPYGPDIPPPKLPRPAIPMVRDPTPSRDVQEPTVG